MKHTYDNIHPKLYLKCLSTSHRNGIKSIERLISIYCTTHTTFHCKRSSDYYLHNEELKTLNNHVTSVAAVFIRCLNVDASSQKNGQLK